MDINWTKHIRDKVEKENFEKEIRSSRRVLDRLKDILKSSGESLQRAEYSSPAYDNPNWAYRQAHANGFHHALNTVINLLTLDQEKRENG